LKYLIDLHADRASRTSTDRLVISKLEIVHAAVQQERRRIAHIYVRMRRSMPCPLANAGIKKATLSGWLLQNC
jgi:hypothetical protein